MMQGSMVDMVPPLSKSAPLWKINSTDDTADATSLLSFYTASAELQLGSCLHSSGLTLEVMLSIGAKPEMVRIIEKQTRSQIGGWVHDKTFDPQKALDQARTLPIEPWAIDRIRATALRFHMTEILELLGWLNV